MIVFQVFTIVVLFFSQSLLILLLLRSFKRKIANAVYFIFPLFVFCVGFSLRLSNNRSLIDLGYFLTDISSLFVYLLFSAFLFLGQVKYWGR